MMRKASEWSLKCDYRKAAALAAAIALMAAGASPAFAQEDQAGSTAAATTASSAETTSGLTPADFAEINARIEQTRAIIEKLKPQAATNNFSPGWEVSLATRLYNRTSGELAAMASLNTYADVTKALSTRRDTRTNLKSHGHGTNNLLFHSIAACRLLDTRNAVGILPANTTRIVNMSDSATQGGAAGCSTTIRNADPVIGDNSAWGALALNVTVANTAAGPAFFRVRPTGSTNTSAFLNWTAANSQVANAGVVELNTGGTFEMFASSATDVIIDVFGAFGRTNQLNCTTVLSADSIVNPDSFTFVADASITACPAGFLDMGYVWLYRTGSGGLGPWINSSFSDNPGADPPGLGWTHVRPSSGSAGSAITVAPGRRCCSIPSVTQ